MSKRRLGEFGASIRVEFVAEAATGDRAGIETVELFVRDVLSSRVTPVRELKEFSRVELDAGETGTARVTLKGEEIGVMGDDGKRATEAGTFEVFASDLSAEFGVERQYQ